MPYFHAGLIKCQANDETTDVTAVIGVDMNAVGGTMTGTMLHTWAMMAVSTAAVKQPPCDGCTRIDALVCMAPVRSPVCVSSCHATKQQIARKKKNQRRKECEMENVIHQNIRAEMMWSTAKWVLHYCDEFIKFNSIENIWFAQIYSRHMNIFILSNFIIH